MRLFTLKEFDDGTLKADYAEYSASGDRIVARSIEPSSLPGSMMELFFNPAQPVEAVADQPPVEVKALRGYLPDGFPFLAFLKAGDVSTWAQLRKRIEDGTLTDIEHIAKGRAEAITAAYNEANEATD